MNRRKFLSYMGCCCSGFFISACSSTPITDRKQLRIYPESVLNAKAAEIFEQVKRKEKLINDSRLDQIKKIGAKIENV